MEEIINVCVICGNDLSCGETVNVTRSLKTLIDTSKASRDDLWQDWINGESVVLHRVCKERYVRDGKELVTSWRQIEESVDLEKSNKPICEWECFAQKRKVNVKPLSDDEQDKELKRKIMEDLPNSALSIMWRTEERLSKAQSPK